MNESLFKKYVDSFFPKLSTLIENVNGKKDGQLKYYHKDTSILRKEYSPDNKWETNSVNTTYVAADIVAVDSELPLKSRATLATANGKLPKIGLKKVLKESDINMLNVMEAQGDNKANIARKLAADSIACDKGLDERNEYSFLYALSNGYVGIPDEDSNSMLRLNFNYQDKNKFGIQNADGVTLDDITNVFAKADEAGNVITKIWIAKSKFDELKKTRSAKELVANYNGQVFTESTNLAVPTASKFKEAFADEYNGAQFEVVDRSVYIEKNGKYVAEKPFNANNIIFVCSDMIGAFTYGRVAEQTHPAKHVDYQTIDGYKLISKYSEVDPLREMTCGQAYSAPIIEDVERIYLLDCTDVQVVDTTAETADTSDVYITVWGIKYNKAEFITALKSVGASVKSNATDEAVIKAVNALDTETENKLKELAESVKA